MKDVLITSSVLIVAVLVLRRLFRKTLSRRAQYAVWVLVLLRLLIPGGLLDASFSVLSATQPVTQRLELGAVYLRPAKELTPQAAQVPISQIPEADENRAMVIWDQEHNQAEGYLVRNADGQSATLYTLRLEPAQVLSAIWKAGMVLMAGFFLVSNALFWHKLRKSRVPYEAESTRPVYLVGEGTLPSPCLFLGAIYLTPAAVETPERLRHVLAHEETHARHLDPLWSLLRCVCLSIYWFDPLVWVAAVASRTDCELACDEGALVRLGEDQRIPYGQTLLALIPVRRGLGNPLLSATTMTSDKRRLKDRVTRIAQKPRRFLAAAITAAVLVAAVSACTFTGVSPSPAAEGPTALTGEELRWFNESFFNSPTGDGDYNLRNQFANPLVLYDRPEDIDLGEVLYCEGGGAQLSDEECRLAFGFPQNDLPTDTFKLTRLEINDRLLANTGHTLSELNQASLGDSYLADYDAYYWMHGDTNYCGDLTFLCGTREDGVVKLYHNGNFSGSGWYCVTLTERADEDIGPYDGADGQAKYWFVSNQECEHPSIPPVLPSGEPDAAISLKDLEPYAAPAVTVAAHPNHYAFNYETCYANWDMNGHNIMVYRAADGVVYAAYVVDDVYYVFLSGLSEDRGCVFFYNDLLGRDGFYVDYSGQYSEHSYGPIRDYYYFNDDGVLTLLARCQAEVGPAPCQLDLDGDGMDELVSARQIFFQRDGQIYEARLDELLLAACPELNYWEGCVWDPYGRYCNATGLSGGTEETGAYTWVRHIYFDGEILQVYRKKPLTVFNHMVEGADAGVPAEVIQEARDYVQSRLEPQDGGTWLLHDNEHGNYPIDGWRVVSFAPPDQDMLGKDWICLYEFHTPQPKEVVWAGGLYVTEDGWVGPFFYPNRLR